MTDYIKYDGNGLRGTRTLEGLGETLDQIAMKCGLLSAGDKSTQKKAGSLIVRLVINQRG